MLRVYLAGPDVFLPDPIGMGGRKKAICAAHGLEGAFPLDAELALSGSAPAKAGFRIYKANKALMESCDLAIANMTPFRGPSMDVGTAFEMGFMRALGRPVLGYTNVADGFFERTKAFLGPREVVARGKAFFDPSGMSIENFDMVDNLMLESAVIESGVTIVRKAVPAKERFTNLDAFAECVKLAAQRFGDSSDAARLSRAGA
ncbi:MAG TPA: nucleoside 2-deoxyribosyltransferase [Alphaproteobacteria bacterium]|nr:nucleoside 2-deoxyribosyltransferase [Alphaproteobacteria bacterium]